jgi:glutamine cyclotransferase
MRSVSLSAGALMLVLPLLFACSSAPQGQWARPQSESAEQPDRQTSQGLPPPVYTFKVRKSFPHDPTAFTQGLVFQDGALFESTGLYGASSLRKVDLETGRVLKKIEVPAEYFAEGMTIFQGKIFQLTWKAHKGFTYDLKSFEKTGEFAYEGEGWGLTHDDQFLIMSDGTNQLRFLDPSSFKVVRTIKVFDAARPLMELNELEYIKGEIYANIWQTNRIARIAPASGEVLGWIDLDGLLKIEDNSQPVDVLNGIAYDEASDRLFVTGKLWPKLFEIQLKKK